MSNKHNAIASKRNEIVTKKTTQKLRFILNTTTKTYMSVKYIPKPKDTMGPEKNLLGADKHNRAQGKLMKSN